MRRVRDSKDCHRYSAKILFQYRVGPAEESSFRTCEERIITFHGRSSQEAYDIAVKKGMASQSSYVNDSGMDVHIEFIGVIDLMELGEECGAEDVWYEIKTMLRPKERRSKIIPRRESLSIFKNRSK